MVELWLGYLSPLKQVLVTCKGDHGPSRALKTLPNDRAGSKFESKFYAQSPSIRIKRVGFSGQNRDRDKNQTKKSFLTCPNLVPKKKKLNRVKKKICQTRPKFNRTFLSALVIHVNVASYLLLPPLQNYCNSCLFQQFFKLMQCFGSTSSAPKLMPQNYVTAPSPDVVRIRIS